MNEIGNKSFLNISNCLVSVDANGPGKRYVIWLQGCNRKCEGCFNPDTHSFTENKMIGIDELADEILANKDIDGISISGGEPLMQVEMLILFLELIKKNSDLSVLLFSGYTLIEINSDNSIKPILGYIDLLVAGSFDCNRVSGEPLLASSNQQIHYITDKLKNEDFKKIDSEVIITNKGEVFITGVRPVEIQ